MHTDDDLFLLAVNLTQRCNLACEHCYMDAAGRNACDSNELGSTEVMQLLDDIAARSTETMVVLTGGEPLLRKDLEQLVEHGTRLGLSIVVGTNGVLLNEQRVQSLQAAGAMGVGISLDSLDPASHDAFRGCPGSWEKTLEAMDHCRKHALPFQVHFSVTEQNAHEVQSMIDFTRASGAHVLNIFFLVCTGRGESMSDITPLRYEQVLRQLVAAQKHSDELIIRARCAPHYKRVAYQDDPQSPLTRAEGYEGGGCLAGIHYCRITPQGDVTACPYIRESEGNIREQGFWQIWDTSDNFQQLRNPQLKGKCAQCEYRKLCGGCRARPLANGGDLMDADPWCAHRPTGEAVIEPLVAREDQKISWSSEAEQRLTRVPGFLRKMVRKRAEAHVRDRGESVITVEHMASLAAKRFGDNFPGGPPAQVRAKLDRLKNETSSSGMAWTTEAKACLEQMPGFLREGVFAVAEDVARQEGRLEVNIKLLKRLEGEDSPETRLPWSKPAEALLEAILSEREPQVQMFVKPSMQQAAEREAKRRKASAVDLQDVRSVLDTDLAGVSWSDEALDRVRCAPEFIRGGIKKAAEFNARREGLPEIRSEDLTRFRNHAMMKAVRRMKGFGMKELNFDAFQVARERVPRLRENTQAATRFSEIQGYVESHQAADGSGLGTLDRSLIDKMKAELTGTAD